MIISSRTWLTFYGANLVRGSKAALVVDLCLLEPFFHEET